MPEIEKLSSQDRINEITDSLEKGIMELFEGGKFKEYLNTMSKFHNYSFNNTMLIALQKPDAALVAGFHTWKNKFERNVNKGEKGIQIFAPAPYTLKKEMEKLDPNTQLPVLDKNGKPITEEVDVKIPAFKVVSVFDVSQTSGKELPTLGADELQGDVSNYEKFFETLRSISPVPIGFEEITSGAKGYFHKTDKRIALNENMSEVQTIKTAIHEIAHAKLHNRDLKKSDIDKPKDRNTEEVEAESIAYTVCQHFGIDTSDYSFGYVAGWGSGKELPELKSSLETIRSTASEFINQISDKLLGLEKEQEHTIIHTLADIENKNSPVGNKPLSEKPDKPNIIGNTPYAEIQDKQYFKLSTPEAKEIAHILSEKQIPFSGRINGDKTTLTINKENVDIYNRILDFKKGGLTNEDVINVTDILSKHIKNNKEERNISVYPDTFGYAKLHGEQEQWSESMKLNKACAEAIIKAVTDNFDGARLNLKAYEEVFDTFGTERVARVVSVQVVTHKWDGRISDKAKTWAAEKTKNLDFTFSENNHEFEYGINSVHSTLVNALAEKVIAKELEVDKSVQQELNAEIAYTGKLPDENISIADRNAFGYISNELLPLTEEKALEFFDNDIAAVYLLYEDDTEGQALERSDIENHRGIFGIETHDWEKIQTMQERTSSLETSEPSKEAILFHGKEDAIGIYQLKDCKDTRDIRFVPLEHLERNGEVPHREDYILVYTRKIEDNQAFDKHKLLNDIYEEFNVNHPKDFDGHSLSVSDVVVIQHNGEASAHYVDNFGFKELQNFGEIQKSPQEKLSPEQKPSLLNQLNKLQQEKCNSPKTEPEKIKSSQKASEISL